MRFLFISLFLWTAFLAQAQTGDLDTYLSAQGLVDAKKLDRSLQMDLKYATTDNFLGEKVYDGISGIWLQAEAAEKLLKAQQYLKQIHPNYSIIVYDATRPMSVQRKMWNLVRGTNKTNYVSNPANGGGLHNYGMAVDVSIVDENGIALPMGSDFDYFGMEAHINKEEELVASGKITQQELKNRRLLRDVMTRAGFRTILYEWWHFNAVTKAQAQAKYKLVE
ncbi:MAG: M15 family metallopeptidase [Tannerellaceae bacterium]|nr:M15 family metallopeptidase [Tannerellaceae bacterium]